MNSSQIIMNEDLIRLLCEAHNVIMDGSYQGDAMLNAAEVVGLLADVIDRLREGQASTEGEEHA